MDVYRIFKPVIFISRVLCLAPFAAVEESGSTRYKFSTLWLLYSILGVCAFFISNISVFWSPTSISNEALQNAFTQVASSVICMPSVVVQVFCLNNGKNVLRILDHVSALDSEHIGARISYYRLYRVFIFHLICCIITLVTFNGTWFAAVDTNYAYIFEMVYYITLFFFSDVVLLLSDTLFIHFVLLLKYRFYVLNDTVINFPVQSLYKMSLNHMIRATAVDHSVNSSISALSTSVTMLKSTLRKVCRHHDFLCDISEFVNRTYSLQILLIVTVNFIKVLFMAHTVSIEFSYASNLQYISSTKFLSMSTIVWLFVLTAKVVLLVVVCNRASHEVSGMHLWCPYVCFLKQWPTE